MDEEEISLKELESIRELSFSDFINFAVFQVLKAQVEDTTKFALAVENLESLLIDELDDNYFKAVSKKAEELEEYYGRGEEEELKKLKELSTFKFRLLIKEIKRRIPAEVEGVL